MKLFRRAAASLLFLAALAGAALAMPDWKPLFATLGIAFVLSWVPALAIFLRRRRQFSGKRIVPCPETGRDATIRIDAGRAAATSLTGNPDLRVESCNRWDGPVGHCWEQCIPAVEAPLKESAQSA